MALIAMTTCRCTACTHHKHAALDAFHAGRMSDPALLVKCGAIALYDAEARFVASSLPRRRREIAPRSKYVEGAAACVSDNDSATEGNTDSDGTDIGWSGCKRDVTYMRPPLLRCLAPLSTLG
jgi:hypothetical protein